MTATQKIKREILIEAGECVDLADIIKDGISEENVDSLYCELRERDAHWDFESEFRQGDVETNLGREYSRHYESKSVAAKCCDGTWVGWTYWYGGGKHGNPDEIEWMNHAYDLNCTEEWKVVLVREFRKC
jgi:hypothetical protein